MYCKDLRQILDSYISDELLVETNHDVLRHLEDCASCRRELAARRDLRIHLRRAVIDSPQSQVDIVFARRLKNELRDAALSHGGVIGGFDLRSIFNPRNFALAFGCFLILGFGGLLIFDRTKLVVLTANTKTNSASNSESEIAAAVHASWQELTSQAVGDHQNCAIEYRLASEPISLDEAAKSYAAFYKDLDQTIETVVITGANAPEFVESHMCIYEGRQFAHIVFKQNGNLVSVLVTTTDLPGETEGITAARNDANTSSAGMHFGHFAMFVVSNLSESENSTLAQRIAPAVRLHTGKLRA